MKKIIIVLTVSLLYSYTSLAGQLYKWTDEDGRIHFSQTKPKDQNTERMYIEAERQGTPITKEELIGEWQSNDEGKEHFILTESRFSIDKQRGDESMHMSGTWKLINKRIFLNVTHGYIEKGASFKDSVRKSLKETVLSALITHLTESELKIMDPKGSTKYTKIQTNDQEQTAPN